MAERSRSASYPPAQSQRSFGTSISQARSRSSSPDPKSSPLAAEAEAARKKFEQGINQLNLAASSDGESSWRIERIHPSETLSLLREDLKRGLALGETTVSHLSNESSATPMVHPQSTYFDAQRGRSSPLSTTQSPDDPDLLHVLTGNPARTQSELGARRPESQRNPRPPFVDGTTNRSGSIIRQQIIYMLQAADQLARSADRLTRSAEILANELGIDTKSIMSRAENQAASVSDCPAMHSPISNEETGSYRSPTRLRRLSSRRSLSGSSFTNRGVAFALDHPTAPDNRPALARRRTSFTDGSRVGSPAETIPEDDTDHGTPRVNGSSAGSRHA